MLSFDGWSIGIGYCIKYIIDIIISAFYIYKAKKNNIKLLYYAAMIFMPYLMIYFTYLVDFFHIIITDNNLLITDTALFIFFTGHVISGLATNSLGLNLVLKERRKTILFTVLVYYLFLEILALIIPHSGVSLSYPTSPGANLIKMYSAPNSIIYYISFPPLILVFFIALALIMKGLRVKGKIRSKFLVLALGFGIGMFFFYIEISFETVGFIYLIVFLLFASLSWVPYYYGLTPIKERKSKKKRTPSDIELKFVSYLTHKSSQPVVSMIETELNRDILIFVSYSSKDSKIYKVREIAEQLKTFPGMKDVLFYEGESIDNIIKYMNDNLGLCDAFLLFCSQNALNSIPIEKEWTAAEAMGVPIIPIFFDLKHIPPLLKSRLGVEYDFYNLDQTVKEIYSAILKRCIETA
jgi:hypothetical protein